MPEARHDKTAGHSARWPSDEPLAQSGGVESPDRLDILPNRLTGKRQVMRDLHLQPELEGRPEELGELLGGVRCHRSAFRGESLDGRARHFHRFATEKVVSPSGSSTSSRST